MKYLSKRFTGNYGIFRFILLILLVLFGSVPAVLTIFENYGDNFSYLVAGGYLLVALIFYLIFFARRWENLSFTKTIIVALVGIGVMFLLSYLVDLAFGFKAETSQNQEAIENMLKVSFSPALIAYMVILGPLLEEFTFREYLPGLLRRLFKRRDQDIKDIISLLLANIVFTLMHTPTDLYSFLAYFSIGLVLVLVRFFTNSLKLSGLVHILWNLISVVILYFAI